MPKCMIDHEAEREAWRKESDRLEARVAELEAALGGLIKRGCPSKPYFENKQNILVCIYCGGSDKSRDSINHMPDCPWVIANSALEGKS